MRGAYWPIVDLHITRASCVGRESGLGDGRLHRAMFFFWGGICIAASSMRLYSL